MDADVMAAMGISGFGKKPRKRQLDAARFDKAKRGEEVCPQHRVIEEVLLIVLRRCPRHLPLKETGRM
jgi:hypothetical protein